MTLRLALAAAASAILAMASAAGADDPPPIFAKLTFAEAVEKTRLTDKILVVKATAAWCGPCKMMDRTTWRDDKVVKWFDANGVAIQFDVDKERELAQKLKIQAMPTMVAFVKGEEFDRIVGYKKADDLLAWAEGVKRGEKSTAAALKKLERAKAGEGRMGMQERLQLAQDLARAGEHEKATGEFVWLWHNMAEEDPAMAGVRGSFMAMSMQQLAAEFEPAKEKFAAIRDATEARLKAGEKTWNDLDDWIVLNEVVGQEEKTLEWFDRIKGDPGGTFDRYWYRLEPLLERHNRWADRGKLIRDPMAKLKQMHAQMKMVERMMPKDAQAGDPDLPARMFRDEAGRLHASLLAAEREEDARKVADEAVALDDTGAMRAAFVEWALKAEQPRAYHAEMLQGVTDTGGRVSVEELRQQLAQKSPREPDR